MESNKNILKLGPLIAKLRKEKGYSQRKFAQISGLSNTTISRIENCETLNPDIETLKLLAVHLDCDESKLVQLVNSPKAYQKPKINASLKFLQQPVKLIKRYSTVSTTGEEEPILPVEHPTAIELADLAPETDPTAKVNLKGMRLITLRLERNITQKELADVLGIDKTLISQYEGEIIKPDYQIAEKLAEFFAVSIEYLIGNPIIQKTIYEEPEKPIHQEMPKIDMKNDNLRPEYLAAAKELQAAGIEIEDVRSFIDMIKKYKR